MNYEITLNDLVRLAEISGRISGITDGIMVPNNDTSTMTDSLYMLSTDLFDIVNKIIEKKQIPHDISKP